MDGILTKHISNNAFPTVDIKEGHPVIKRIVDKADLGLRKGNKIIKEIGETLLQRLSPRTIHTTPAMVGH